MPAMAASFSIPPNSTAAQTLGNNETGTVGAGNTLSVTGTAITWMGSAGAPGAVITNNGTISATTRGIDTPNSAISGDLTLLNNAGATLTSTNDAVRIQNNLTTGTVTVNNAGTIQSTGTGQAFDFAGVTSTAAVFAITNQTGATIKAVGAEAIVVGGGATTITNSGLIDSTTGAFRGIRANNSLNNVTSVSVVNKAGGTIQSTDDAFQINGSGTTNATTTATFSVDNAGTIRSTTGQALDFDNLTSAAATVIITNRAGGLITADNADAIRAGQNFTINNSGQIIANSAPMPTDRPGADGIDLQLNHSGTVNNLAGGLISGAKNGLGSDVGSAVTVNNAAGATIIGRDGAGVGSGGTANVTNYGTITGAIDSTSARGDGDGIDVDFALTLTNFGLIQGTGAKGADDGGRLNNSEGLAIGGGTIRNSGTIVGAGAGIVVNNDSNLNRSRSGSAALDLINYAGGSIIGQNSYAIRSENKTGTAADNDTVVNYGTIIGNGIIPDANGITRLQDGVTADSGSVGTLNGVTYTGTGATRFIRGDGAAIQLGEGNDVLTNYGTIIGNTGSAISLEGGDDTLNLYTGSSITGRIDGGVGANTINLYSSGSGTGSLANVINFQVLNVGGGVWSLLDTQSYANGVTVAAGAALQFGNGGVGGAIAGNIANNGTVAFNRSDSFTYAGAVSGSGGVSQIGGGTTVLSGANTYTGATVVTAGTLEIASGGSIARSASLTNSGAFFVDAGGSATFGSVTNNKGGSITVAAGGTLRDDLTNAGTINNNGAYIANVASNTGSITNNSVWTGNVVSNIGTITNNTTWAGTVSNAGTFNNAAGATISGLFTNTGGVINNAGTLSGGLNLVGGALTGAGSVGVLNFSSGVFAPGNGTAGSSMTVAGNLVLASAVQYVVQVNPTTSSFARVNGSATLGGATVNATYANGSYVSKRYTILTAAGGLNGTFGAVVNSNLPASFTSSLSYDANNAYLNLALTYSGLNRNQQGVGNALANFFSTTGGIPLAFGALNAAGLTQVSGELGTGAQQTSFDAMTMFMGMITDPSAAGRDMTQGTAAGYADEALNYAAKRRPADALAAIYRKAPPMAPAFEARWNVWAAGFGGSRSTDGNAALGSNNANSSIGGVAVGADYWLSPSTVAGFALAGGGTNFSVANGGSGRSDLFQAGAFVRHTIGSAYLTAAAAYGWQDITTDRTVSLAGIDRLRAQFNANTYSGRIEGGNRLVLPWMGGVGVTPYAAAQITAIDLPGYAETSGGANTFALAYASKTATATRTELGLRSDKSFAVADAILTLRGRAAWAHDFDTDRSIAATFQTLPGAGFTVNGAAQARDAALTTASAEMRFVSGISVGATFEGEFSDVTRSYAGKGVVRYAW